MNISRKKSFDHRFSGPIDLLIRSWLDFQTSFSAMQEVLQIGADRSSYKRTHFQTMLHRFKGEITEMRLFCEHAIPELGKIHRFNTVLFPN